MRIDFNPEIEKDQRASCYPAQKVHCERVALGESGAGESEERVSDEIVQKDHVDYATEHEPDVVVQWHSFEDIVGIHFGNELFFHPGVNTRSTSGIEPAVVFYLTDDPAFFGLLFEDVTQTGVVGSSPEGEVEEEENLG